MEKAFWQSIKEQEFQVPEGYTLSGLTSDLMACLGSPDSELRDSLAYEILGHWIATGAYPAEGLAALMERLMEQLKEGLGERETDTVFGRSFSALVLAEAVAADATVRSLPTERIRQTLHAALRYLAAEADLRGYVCDKGWAHAAAHAADLLRALAGHPALGAGDLEAILHAVAEKLTAPTPYPFLSSEEERLAVAVIAVLRRGLVPLSRTAALLRGIAACTPAAGSPEDDRRAARHNAKSFLMSLHALLAWQDPPLPGTVALQHEVENAVRTVLPWV